MEFFDEILTRNIEKIYPSKESLLKRLTSNEKLIIYFGIDPSSPKIHLGNAIAIRKLRELQVLGNKIILLIGDFTGMIGDPTGKDTARKPLTRQEVLDNCNTYKEQAARILSFSGKNPAEIAYNSHWLAKLSFEEIIKLTSHFTVSQMLERDMFQKRIQEGKPIGLHEFLYPLMQGYDSVSMDVDMEIGGTDQTFNMLVGRQLMKELKNKEKFVLTVPLLEGTDGRKMSKSYGNSIDIGSPAQEMFGKLMSLKDELILKYFEMCTEISTEEIKKIRVRLKKENPINIKKDLAKVIVTMYHDLEEAEKAQEEFEWVVQKKELPDEIVEIEIKMTDLPEETTYATLTTFSGATASNAEANRLAQQGGLFFDNVKIKDAREKLVLKPEENHIIKTGKRRFLRIKVIG